MADGQLRRAAARCSPILRVNVVAPGLLLTRAYLAGPQELSVTDGANDVMRRMWVRAGGVVAPLAVARLDAGARAVLVRRRDRRRSSSRSGDRAGRKDGAWPRPDRV